MSSHSNDYNFATFIISYVSLSVIAGLFTFRLLNSLLDTILLPLIDITILPNCKFHKLTKSYDYKKKNTESKFNNKDYVYVFQPGIFIKEFVIWSFMMIVLYLIYSITKKNKK